MAFDVTDVILAIAVVVGLIGNARNRTWRTRGVSERERLIRLFKSNGLAFLVLCIGLWFFLPSTPSLGTFGYPNSVTDISSQDQLLRYLQEYNRAIIRLSKSLHWLLFAGVWWVGAVLWSMMKAVDGGASGPNPTAVVDKQSNNRMEPSPEQSRVIVSPPGAAHSEAFCGPERRHAAVERTT